MTSTCKWNTKKLKNVTNNYNKPQLICNYIINHAINVIKEIKRSAALIYSAS